MKNLKYFFEFLIIIILFLIFRIIGYKACIKFRIFYWKNYWSKFRSKKKLLKKILKILNHQLKINEIKKS